MTTDVVCTIFSDGGGERSSTAAAASIIEWHNQRVQLVAFLGGATNNEAEIFGGLLAFSFIHAHTVSTSGGSVRWVCDSEYVLKSATEYIHNWQRNGWKTAAKKPVKNQALWRSYAELAKGFKVQAEHIYGHTGHEENEACDSASTWARMEGARCLKESGTGALFSDLPGHAQGVWHLIDGRPFLSRLRELEERELEKSDALLLRDQLRTVSFAADAAVPTNSAEEVARRKLLHIKQTLRSAHRDLAELERVLPEARELRSQLAQALK